MSNIRNFSRHRWQVADQGLALQEFIAQDAQVHMLFRGATNLEQVVNMLVNLVKADSPEFLQQEINQESLLQILSSGFRTMVLKSLQGDELSQSEHLVCLMARHFSQKNYEPELSEEAQNLCQQTLGLYSQWDAEMTKRRRSQRNMMK
ncbi:hypothetical protein [Ferrimonas aestuarii]|uniref:Uncharacterized protein n=1 Tax=Ferrimonas aestuarii TaxID=2569539 RepID=A0A4U1BR11_9GAMM|nr:hypothetical protein [Ferrimonas aestuarii]TKB56588.1 hypothetical protein FCL42_05495 [Ferrimonas aestuarii]